LKNKSIIVNKHYDPAILRTIVTRYWWWPLLFVLFFSSFAYFILRYTKPVFESTMVIQLEKNDAAKEIIAIENINSRNGDISAEIELLRSQLIFEKAIQKLNYSTSYFSEGQFLTQEKYNSSSFMVQSFELKDSTLLSVPIYLKYNRGVITLNYSFKNKTHTISGKLGEHLINSHFNIVIKAANKSELEREATKNQLYFIFNSIESYTAAMLGSLQVLPIDPVAKTIQITFTGNNPRQCQDIINAVAETFNQFEKENKRNGSDNILAFIKQQLDSLTIELNQSNDALIDFQRKSNVSTIEEANEKLSSSVTDLQDKLTALDEEIRSLNSVNLKLKSDPNRLDVYRLLPEMLGKSYESALSAQISALFELLDRKEELLFRVTPENSEIKAINTKIQLKLAAIRKSIGAILDRMNTDSKIISSKIAGFENQMLELPEKKIQYSKLINAQNFNEEYYTLLSDKQTQYLISDAGYTSSNRILSRPTISLDPISPNRKFIYSSFLMIGMFLGLGILVLKYLTYNEINQIDELTKLLPTKASIVQIIKQLRFLLLYPGKEKHSLH